MKHQNYEKRMFNKQLDQKDDMSNTNAVMAPAALAAVVISSSPSQVITFQHFTPADSLVVLKSIIQ